MHSTVHVEEREQVVLERNLKKDVFIWLIFPGIIAYHGKEAVAAGAVAGHTASIVCLEGIIPGTQKNTFVSFGNVRNY